MASSAETRQRLLEAAIRTLAVEGHDGTTERSIARIGRFAPEVLYHHFDDLEALFVAALRHTSEVQRARYEEALGSCADATQLLSRFRELYAEDMRDQGHIEAIQELLTASSSSPRLREELITHVESWSEFATTAIGRLVQGTTFDGLVPSRDLGVLAVAMFLGMQTLIRLDGDRSRIESLFTTAEPAAVLWDAFSGARRTDP
ncbi:TetR/AcrR family transcriptional regulator [Actinomadura decatromicini]|uniref:TetR/AcrR family transcriptional regulator n=1 Tax=Actinomadura decatromicini TaxID=2604572 RepID=A0A5D3F2X0_9ACTN|nr:TetR/AcrR family transcriptional regulator [Actinomadura decatromicini]TYK43357.1 TetR/AcrR family transcriptional regulator [Actinomadura decatromicini]